MSWTMVDILTGVVVAAASVPERIYNPITAMGFTFQLDNNKK